MPEHDGVDVAEATAKRPAESDQHRPPNHRGRDRAHNFHRPRPAAVREADPVAGDLHHAGPRQDDARGTVVVALHRHHRRNRGQALEEREVCDVAGMEDDVDAREHIKHRVGQLGDPFADVRVGNHADPRDHDARLTPPRRGRAQRPWPPPRPCLERMPNRARSGTADRR